MAKTEYVFYYDRKKLVWLLGFYLVLLISAVGVTAAGGVGSWPVLVLPVLAVAGAAYVYFFPKKLAVLSEEGIEIDHNALLKWEDIQAAEERFVSTVSKRKIIILRLREGVKYPLTFMQYICRNSEFTEFSIPLYAMTFQDQEAIRLLVTEYASYKDYTLEE